MRARKLGFEACDLVTIGFGLIVATIALAFRNHLDDPRVVGRYLAVAMGYAGAIRLLSRAGAKPMAMNLFRAVAISWAIPYMFLQLSQVLPFVVGMTYERDLVAIDTAIFGTEPLAALEPLLQPLVVDVLQVAYVMFYPMFLWGLLLLFKREYRDFNSYAAAVALVQCATYLGYFLVPAMSPYRVAALPEYAGLFHFTQPIQGWLIQPWLGPAIHHAESVTLDCFPSGHTAGAVTVLLAMWRWRRKVFWAILPIQTMLILATVYLRYHYVTDVLAGLVMGVACWYGGIALNEWLLKEPDEVELAKEVPS